MFRVVATLISGCLFSVNSLADDALLQAFQDQGIPLSPELEQQVLLSSGDSIPGAIAAVVSSFPKDKSLVEATIYTSILVVPDLEQDIIVASKDAAPSASPGINAGVVAATGDHSAFGRAIASARAGFSVPPHGKPPQPSPN